MKKSNIGRPDFKWDETDPEGFRAGMARLGGLLGAKETGITVYELPPGQAVCPYHYECGEEEWLLVLSGTPTLRTPTGEERLEPWDVACFPRGPEGAHRIANVASAPARVLIVAERAELADTVYSDSDKIGIYGRDLRLLFRRSDQRDYWDGE